MLFGKRGTAQTYGKIPDVEYYHGDMDYIRTWHDYWKSVHPEAFAIDEITWRDLDMDRLFKRINRGLTTSGEQALYHLLRTPAVDKEEWERRRSLVLLMEDNKTREKAQAMLSPLGCVRRAGPCTSCMTPNAKHGRLLLCVLLALLLPLSLLIAPLLGKYAMLPVFCVITLNALTHEFLKRNLAGELDAVNYMVSLARAAERFRKTGFLREHLFPAFDALVRLRHVLRIGFAVPADVGGNPLDLFFTITLLDMIAFERLKRIFRNNRQDVLLLHDVLGRLDAAISVASFRRTLPCWCEPGLDFSPNAPHAITAEGIIHPLIAHPVPNGLHAGRSLLITGSNASGKSTYLRTSAMCALLAQAICTAPACSYEAPAFHIFTSMALSDDLIAGESYYVAEMRALKRILNALHDPVPVLCIVDEVLRGTNTAERIAASTEILAMLDKAGALCLAATHDLELCELLRDRYVNMHFEERIEDGRMLFDYRIRPGKAATRNAINLLELIGLDQSIIEGAHARAERFLQTGLWS